MTDLSCQPTVIQNKIYEFLAFHDLLELNQVSKKIKRLTELISSHTLSVSKLSYGLYKFTDIRTTERTAYNYFMNIEKKKPNNCKEKKIIPVTDNENPYYEYIAYKDYIAVYYDNKAEIYQLDQDEYKLISTFKTKCTRNTQQTSFVFPFLTTDGAKIVDCINKREYIIDNTEKIHCKLRKLYANETKNGIVYEYYIHTNNVLSHYKYNIEIDKWILINTIDIYNFYGSNQLLTNDKEIYSFSNSNKPCLVYKIPETSELNKILKRNIQVTYFNKYRILVTNIPGEKEEQLDDDEYEETLDNLIGWDYNGKELWRIKIYSGHRIIPVSANSIYPYYGYITASCGQFDRTNIIDIQTGAIVSNNRYEWEKEEYGMIGKGAFVGLGYISDLSYLPIKNGINTQEVKKVEEHNIDTNDDISFEKVEEHNIDTDNDIDFEKVEEHNIDTDNDIDFENIYDGLNALIGFGLLIFSDDYFNFNKKEVDINPISINIWSFLLKDMKS
jgi:hypothetical protein